MSKEKIEYAVVTDWMGFTLATFTNSETCIDEAIEWKDKKSYEYAENDNGREILIDSEEFEERFNSASEDMYVEAYNENGERVAFEF